MNQSKAAGFFITLLSAAAAVFYVLWFFGVFVWLDPELAVKIPVLLIVLFLLFVAGWIGYVMLTAPRPPVVGGETTARRLARPELSRA